MDLNDVLSATTKITCEFLGEKIELEVYTAGFNRLTAEEAEQLRNIEGNGDQFKRSVDVGLKTLPLLIKSWDLKFKGEPLDIARVAEVDENGHRVIPIPAALLDALWAAMEDTVQGRPTAAEQLPTGSAQAENASDETAIQ